MSIFPYLSDLPKELAFSDPVNIPSEGIYIVSKVNGKYTITDVSMLYNDELSYFLSILEKSVIYENNTIYMGICLFEDGVQKTHPLIDYEVVIIGNFKMIKIKYDQKYYLYKELFPKYSIKSIDAAIEKTLLSTKCNIFDLQDTNIDIENCWIVPRTEKRKLSIHNQTVPEKFIFLKNKLNEEKSKLDGIDWSKFRLLSKWPYEKLRGKNGIVHRHYNGEIVTNAHLKFYEMVNILDKKFNIIPNTFSSFHIAEAPGNFLLAMNHYLKTHKKSSKENKWNWFANTYVEKNFQGGYLGDDYGIISNFKEKWLLGCDGTGDITSPDNILSFFKTISEKMGMVDMVTSDVKFVGKEENFNEEENVNKPVHLAHMIISLLVLKQGGTMILKEFTFLERLSIDLLYFISSFFEKTLIYKPKTSRPSNSEVYIVGINYSGSVDLPITFLLEYMKEIRFEANEKPKKGIVENIPQSFFDEIYRIQEKLVNNQIEEIDRNLSISLEDRTKKEKNRKVVQDWIDYVDIKVLNPNDYMLKK